MTQCVTCIGVRPHAPVALLSSSTVSRLPARSGLLVAGTTADARFEETLAVAVSTAWRAVLDGIHLVVPALSMRGKVITSADSIRVLSQWHRVFALLPAAVPERDTVDALIANVGAGGSLLMVVGNGVPSEFLFYVESAALAAGIRIIDCAQYVGGQR